MQTKLPSDQLAELRRAYPGAQLTEEGGTEFVFLPQLELPDTVTPERTDALLCPSPRDGYSSRLYLADRPTGGVANERNWHVTGLRIIGRPWHAASWQTPNGLRLVQMIAAHLDMLQPS